MLFKRLGQKTQCIFTIVGIVAIVGSVLAGRGWASDGNPDTQAPPIIEPAQNETRTAIPVAIHRSADGFQLMRGGIPYFIKGIGGHQHLDQAAAAGANSVRTWDAQDAGRLLDRAERLGMTVTLGIWLSHKAADYLDPDYTDRKRREVLDLVGRLASHPALLMWALGNEINLEGAGTPCTWQYVNELAGLIKAADPHHPVISVIAVDPTTPDMVAAHAPQIQALGINAYGALGDVRTIVDASSFAGPYIVTEWGVDGHWEATETIWGRPIEPTSAQKSANYLSRYRDDILANRDRCMGAYVFLWGQKQERTPTWYSMFIESLPESGIHPVACPTVDAMHFNWSGRWPANRAPQVDRITINDIPVSGDLRLAPGEALTARVAASDPDTDGLRYIWELLEEPTTLGIGGAFEPRPVSLGGRVDGDLPELRLQAPEKSGEYRLFVYVLDHNGHVGTANFPFQVHLLERQTNLAEAPPAGTIN
jgi:hypothetical protein